MEKVDICFQPCEGDRSCPHGRFCDRHYGICERLRGEGEFCRRDGHCHRQHECVFGRCRVAVQLPDLGNPWPLLFYLKNTERNYFSLFLLATSAIIYTQDCNHQLRYCNQQIINYCVLKIMTYRRFIQIHCNNHCFSSRLQHRLLLASWSDATCAKNYIILEL